MMRAVVFDKRLHYEENRPKPEARPGWARVRVKYAGICKTDVEITRGYMGFQGILGHEFIGVVDSCDDPAWIGKRVVGEINAACGRCHWCAWGLGRHCPNRLTLGIDRLDGCMADFCVLPTANLYAVDDAISDERAVLTEPLSAACEILEQIAVRKTDRIVVLGDGPLGILCAWVLSTVDSDITLLGHHPEKLAVAAWRRIKTTLAPRNTAPGADIVVEATGRAKGFSDAMALCRPRGVIVLKSTVAGHGEINLTPLVVNELTVVGSRCGCFRDGLAMMRNFSDMPLERLITHRYAIADASTAFDKAAGGPALKVLLDMAAR